MKTMKKMIIAFIIVAVILELLILFLSFKNITNFFNGPVNFTTSKVINSGGSEVSNNKDSNIFISGDQTKSEKKELKNIIAPVLKGKKSDLAKAVAINAWVRSQCSKLGGGGISGGSLDVLQQFESGGAGVCTDFTKLYIGAARASGIPARYVSLYRDAPFNKFDSHAIAEVFVDDEWVVMDPTFGTYYEIDGELSSAEDIRENFLAPLADQREVDIKYAGKKYDPTPNEYYVNIFSLYNNVIYHMPRYERDTFRWYLSRIPVTNYYNNELYSFESKDSSPFLINNFVQLTTSIILPAIIIILVSGLILIQILSARKKE